MKAVFWGTLVILVGTNSFPAHAGKNSTMTSFQCLPVKGIKPWCACKSSLTGSIIDLSSFGTELENKDAKATNRSPKFVSENAIQGWQIAWTPCEDFDVFANDSTEGVKACKEVGFARFTTPPSKICYGYGSHESSAHFFSNGYDQKTGKEGYKIVFDYKPKPKEGTPGTAKIHLECTKDDVNRLHYNWHHAGVQDVTFYSKCCCENQPCRKNPVDPKSKFGKIAGITVGSIAGAIVLVVLAIVGIKKKRNRPRHPVQVEPREDDERQHLVRRV